MWILQANTKLLARFYCLSLFANIRAGSFSDWNSNWTSQEFCRNLWSSAFPEVFCWQNFLAWLKRDDCGIHQEFQFEFRSEKQPTSLINYRVHHGKVGFFKLPLTERNVHVRSCLKLVLRFWDLRNFAITTGLHEMHIVRHLLTVQFENVSSSLMNFELLRVLWVLFKQYK